MPAAGNHFLEFKGTRVVVNVTKEKRMLRDREEVTESLKLTLLNSDRSVLEKLVKEAHRVFQERTKTRIQIYR